MEAATRAHIHGNRRAGDGCGPSSRNRHHNPALRTVTPVSMMRTAGADPTPASSMKKNNADAKPGPNSAAREASPRIIIQRGPGHAVGDNALDRNQPVLIHKMSATQLTGLPSFRTGPHRFQNPSRPYSLARRRQTRNP